MLIAQGLILLVLLLIFIQDIGSRSVYWLLFPVLAVLLIGARWLTNRDFGVILQPGLINIAFLILQLLLLTLYFSIKNRQLVNITNGLLGLGDVLFLFCIAFYLSVLNFVVFYIASIAIVLLAWLVWRLISATANKHIPLAGLQAFIFGLFLTLDWYWLHFKLTDDNWLINLINK